MDPLKGIGILWIENQRLAAEYASLLDLVQRIQDGVVPAASVRIDQKAQTWALMVEAGKPPEA